MKKHVGVNALRGSPSASRVLEIDSLQCGQCSCPEFGLVVNHTDVSRLALETPNVILFETTRDKRGTYGLPTDFEVELMINYCDEDATGRRTHRVLMFGHRTVPRRSMKLKQHSSTKSWPSLKMESGEAGLEHW